jgi:hypothetical protein
MPTDFCKTIEAFRTDRARLRCGPGTGTGDRPPAPPNRETTLRHSAVQRYESARG